MLPRLQERGYAVRCMARDARRLTARVNERTTVIEADVLDPSSLDRALQGIDVAFYLIHSMGDTGDPVAREGRAARNFATAARRAGCRRIVYLGGLGQAAQLSPHPRGRREAGRVLAASGVQTIELRAAVIIGSGSLAFEMIRALVDRLPVMIVPSWVATPTQPLAVEDVLGYLLEAVEVDVAGHQIYEIGAPDRASCGDMMREYARQRGLRRWMIPVPVLIPRLSSRWLGLVTPLYARVGRNLILDLGDDATIADSRALEAFTVRPRTMAEAIARAIEYEDRVWAETRWSDAVSSHGPPPVSADVLRGSRRVDVRKLRVDCPPEFAFQPIQSIGGTMGWYAVDFLWRMRGLIDIFAGGAGARRGRRHPQELRVGDTVDWWRVEEIEPPRLLRLSAEMKAPGRAWLQFEVEPDGDGSIIHQTAIFDAAGIAGLAYWYAVAPFHGVVFPGMLRGIARRARALYLFQESKVTVSE